MAKMATLEQGIHYINLCSYDIRNGIDLVLYPHMEHSFIILFVFPNIWYPVMFLFTFPFDVKGINLPSGFQKFS